MRLTIGFRPNASLPNRSQENRFDFKKENEMETRGKVLVLVSSGHGLPLQDGKVYSGAGYYLNELTVPVRALMKNGYEITFANPKGNTPQMDVNSATAMFFGGDEAKLQGLSTLSRELDWAQKPSSYLGCHRIGLGSI
jgi:hypothetical protein